LQTEVFYLVHDVAIVVFRRALVLVWLDGADVTGCALHEGSDEIVRGSLDLISRSGRTTFVILVDIVGEEGVDEVIRALACKVQKILQQLILVLALLMMSAKS